MIFHNGGKFSGDEKELPQRTQEGAVQYKEPATMKALSVIATIISVIILIAAYALVCLRAGRPVFSWVGIILPMLCLVPHEILHALCFKGDVYMFNDMKKNMMMFVAGTEDFSKTRFILMSLCPNLVFGLLPLVLYMIFPDQNWLGVMGAFALSMGAGDYYNIYNCVRQVPKGGLSFMSGMHTYWYMPRA